MAAELAGDSAPLVGADAERQALIERWTERHGVDAARRLAEAQDDLAANLAGDVQPRSRAGPPASGRRARVPRRPLTVLLRPPRASAISLSQPLPSQVAEPCPGRRDPRPSGRLPGVPVSSSSHAAPTPTTPPSRHRAVSLGSAVTAPSSVTPDPVLARAAVAPAPARHHPPVA